MSDKWTTIVCTECGDPVEASGTITLPFVCGQCIAEFQEKIAPALVEAAERVNAASHVEAYVGDPGDEHEHVHNSADSCCGEPEGDLDSTNQLIADLTETLERQTKVIKNLESANAQWKDLFEQAMTAGETLDMIAEDLSRENDELDKKADGLMDELKTSQRRVETYRQMFYDVFYEASFYENRGFWARLFNRRYRKQPTSYLNRVVSNDRQTSG